MQLTEQHIIKFNNNFYKEIDGLCFDSKNLYNSCLYVVKEGYKNNTSILYNLHHLMKDTEQYKKLPAKVASTVLLMVQKNFKSYFKASAEYKKNPTKFLSKPKIPKYLDKVNGRFVTSYTNQAISKKVFKASGKILLSKSNIEFNTKITDFKSIDCVRLIPKIGYYVIELVYTIKDKEKLEDNNKYLGIDLGINNLATCTTNYKDIKPFIINGKPLKSINQYYNKKKGYYQSILEKKNKTKKSKRLNRLNLKRKNKIDNYLHKASKQIVKIAKDNNINTIIVGKNDNWKQETNMGKQNNQKFVNIPHSRFIDMLIYKCEIEGINIIIQEESYTSKASFLNLDKIPKYNKDKVEKHTFSGYRESRGIYKIKGTDKKINADVNGSYNIIRKAVPNVFIDGIEGFGVIPFKFNI